MRRNINRNGNNMIKRRVLSGITLYSLSQDQLSLHARVWLYLTVSLMALSKAFQGSWLDPEAKHRWLRYECDGEKKWYSSLEILKSMCSAHYGNIMVMRMNYEAKKACPLSSCWISFIPGNYIRTKTGKAVMYTVVKCKDSGFA